MNPQPAELPLELVGKYDRPGPRYTSYPTAPVWSGDFGPEEYGQALDAADRRPEDELALYVHLPFCERRCLFCGCNVVITRREDIVEEYLARLFTEIERTAARLPHRRRAAALHLGGGTPTHLDCSQLERLHREISRRFEVDPEGEIAIEVHPPITTHAQLETLRRLGFRRISFGVQDLDWEVQQVIERDQTVEQTERLLEWSRELGFSGVNFDLIYGLPAQTPETWEFTLNEVLRMRPDRLAIYSYAHVPWIKPHQKRLPADRIPGPVVKIGLFREARRRLLEGGYREIGMDHFAIPEDDLSRAAEEGRLYRNFMGYTVRPAADFLGFGVSAISEVENTYAQNSSKLNRWNDAIDAGRLATERGFQLSGEDRLRKRIIDSLMCNLRLDLAGIERLSGKPFQESFPRQWKALAGFEQDGLVERGSRMLVVTPLGRTLVRNIAMLFDAYLEPHSEKPIFSRTV